MGEKIELQKIEAVYLGKRMSPKNKVLCAFIAKSVLLSYNLADFDKSNSGVFPADVTEAIDRAASVFPSKGAPASIGGLYEVEGKQDETGRITSMVVGKYRWLGSLDDEASARYVLAWRTMSNQIEQDKRRQSAEKNAENDPALRNALATLKMRYRKLPPGYRRGFQLWLLEEMEKR
jgi:hypothetical protein